jgi:hypothetical protein
MNMLRSWRVMSCSLLMPAPAGVDAVEHVDGAPEHVAFVLKGGRCSGFLELSPV